MGLPQIVLMAASTRPQTLKYTYERLTDHAGIRRLYAEGRIARPWLWFNKRRGEKTPEYFDGELWHVTDHQKGRPFVLAFFEMFKQADPDSDLIFIEDDLAPCEHAIERVISVDLPWDCGAVTFFDYRNEWVAQGLWPHPKKRDLWGSQCLRFPARHLLNLKGIAERREIEVREGTDAWTGLAVEKLGLTIYGWAPDVFQHTGMLSAYAPGRIPPISKTFPGETFDARKDWDGTVATDWFKPTEDLYCPLHRKVHDVKDFGRCPNWRTG